MTTTLAILLKKVVDADRWDAEDNVGRLGFVTFAAFLDAGFLPCGAKPISGPLLKRVRGTGWSLSRHFTAPQLVYRKDAEAAVLKLSAQGSDVVFHAYLTKGGADRWSAYRERLDAAALAPLLTRGLDDTALALRTVAAGAWLWKALADGLCRDLLLDLCRRNGLPVEPSFMSLPADVKVNILHRLTDDKDIARVGCTSKETRCLVNEHDGELWKAMYDNDDDDDQLSPISWKERYVNAWRKARDSRFTNPFLIFPTSGRGRLRAIRTWPPSLAQKFNTISREIIVKRLITFGPAQVGPRLRPRLAPPLWETYWNIYEDVRLYSALRSGLWDSFSGAWRCDDPPERETVVAQGKKKTTRGHRPRVVWNDHRKQHGGAGAIHSPSSRYRWKHR